MHTRDKRINMMRGNNDAIKETESGSELGRKRLGEVVAKSNDDKGKDTVNKNEGEDEENENEGDRNKDAVDEGKVEMIKDKGTSDWR